MTRSTAEAATTSCQAVSAPTAFVFADGFGADRVIDYEAGQDQFDFTAVGGVHGFGDLFLQRIDSDTVLIDFDGIMGGDTVTVRKDDNCGAECQSSRLPVHVVPENKPKTASQFLNWTRAYVLRHARKAT